MFITCGGVRSHGLGKNREAYELNCFCGMVNRRKVFNLTSSRDHCQRSSPTRISDTPRAGFEPAENLSSGLVEWSCAVVIKVGWGNIWQTWWGRQGSSRYEEFWYQYLRWIKLELAWSNKNSLYFENNKPSPIFSVARTVGSGNIWIYFISHLFSIIVNKFYLH